MDFKDAIKLLSERAVKLKDSLQTEESVKNALVMPFLQATHTTKGGGFL